MGKARDGKKNTGIAREEFLTSGVIGLLTGPHLSKMSENNDLKR
jgi:hypothetical protein